MHELRKKGGTGILIEYGDYSSKMSKSEEKNKIKRYVIYSNSLRIIS